MRCTFCSEGIWHSSLLYSLRLPPVLCPSPSLSLSVAAAPWSVVNSMWQNSPEFLKRRYSAYPNRAINPWGAMKELTYKGFWAWNKNTQSNVKIRSQTKELRVENTVPPLKMVLRLILNNLVSDYQIIFNQIIFNKKDNSKALRLQQKRGKGTS